MMNSNPEESLKTALTMMELMRRPNLSKEVEKPGNNGSSLDHLIKVQPHERGQNRPR